MAMRRSLVAGIGLALLAPLAAPGIGSAAPAADPAVTKATSWLLTQQQPDGGFEVSGFPGFETSDAVLALAAGGQSGPTWDKASALSGIQAIQSVDTSGKDPLDALDDLVDSGDTTTVAAAARGAKVLALVADPLGIDGADFDPSADSGEAVDLFSRIESHVQLDGTVAFGAQFNGVLYTAIGFAAVAHPQPSGITGQIKAAQRSDGSWNFAGDQDPGTDGDVDTTAVALVALKSLGLDTTDPVVLKGVQYLASQQSDSGAWSAFGSDDPNSTASAALALADLHIDLSRKNWRADFGSPFPANTPYVGPYAWLKGQQATDGRVASPNDSFGLNTFATSQSTQALARQWYLAGDRRALVIGLSVVLASPAGAPSAAAATVASDGLGANPSIRTARTTAASDTVYGQLGREAAVADLFQRAFGRAIDSSGRAYWSKKLITLTRPQILSRLTGSSEYFRKHGGTTSSFVDAVYQSVLGRTADPSGRAYWIRKIDGGDSILHVAQSLVKSSEFKRHEVDAAFQQVLRRAPSTQERTDGLVTAAARIEALMVRLASSREFYDHPAGLPG